MSTPEDDKEKSAAGSQPVAERNAFSNLAKAACAEVDCAQNLGPLHAVSSSTVTRAEHIAKGEPAHRVLGRQRARPRCHRAADRLPFDPGALPRTRGPRPLLRERFLEGRRQVRGG